MPSITDIDLFSIPCYQGEQSYLEVFDSMQSIPIRLNRVFTITADAGIIRGKHAHIECTQVCVCLSGTCKITFTDSVRTESIILDDPTSALLIPPLIWAEQEYLETPTILMVLCDRNYEEHDYLRNYQQYVNYCQQLQS